MADVTGRGQRTMEKIMMRILLVFLVLPFRLVADDIKEIRQEYYAAVNDGAAADRFYHKLKDRHSSDALLMAYYGSAQALLAKHVWNPWKKVTFLKGGLKELEVAVNKKPENLEIRLLRFSIEHYVPSFLGLSGHLESDRKMIIALAATDRLNASDRGLVKLMMQFFRDSGRFTAKELGILEESSKDG